MDILAVNNFGDTRSGGLVGPMGLLIIVLMCVATVLLIRNMSKRVRRLPDSFADPAEQNRVAEIAKLEADLGRPDPQPGAGVDADRSTDPVPSADAEVERVRDDERRSTPEGGEGRA